MADQPSPHAFPWGTTILLFIAAFLYVAFIANLLGSRGSDAAGRGMALGFAAIAGLILWVVLATLFAVAFFNGRMPGYATAAAIVLVPLSAIAAAAAAGLYSERHGDWLIAVPLLLPPLLALYGLWARLSAWHGTFEPGPTTALLGGAIVVLTVVPLVLTTIEFMPDPARDAARAAELKAREDELKKREQEALAEEAARFARLGPDSSLRDYFEYLAPGDSRFKEAVAGARLLKSRTADAAALLQEGQIRGLAELWRLDVDPAAVCSAYGAALSSEAGKIVKTRSDYISVAIDLEWQLPNIAWLMGRGCDIAEALAEAEARIRAVSDSSRLDKLADTLAGLREHR
jgi:hypothetical protein